MQGRVCPKCFTRWYSSDSSNIWICASCKSNIPVPKEVSMIKLYKIYICEEEGWVTANPHNFESEIEEYKRECNKKIDLNQTMDKIKKLNIGEEFEVEELKFKFFEMSLEEFSKLGEWGGW